MPLSQSTLADLNFTARDTPSAMARKLDALLKAVKVEANLTAQSVVNVTNHGRDNGPLSPELIPEADIGEYTTATTENTVFEVCEGADLVTVAWLPINTDFIYRGEWRARLSKDAAGSATIGLFTSITVYDEAGRYLGEVALSEQETDWTTATDWQLYQSQISGAEIRAAFEDSGFIRAALTRTGDACAVTQISRASIGRYIITQDGGNAEDWANLAEQFANAADTSRGAAVTAANNAAAARLLAEQALAAAEQESANATQAAIDAAGDAAIAAGHATTAGDFADVAEGWASSASASANVAFGHSEDANTSAVAAANSAQSAAISVTDAAAEASAAQTARLAAESARDQAGQSASAAFDSEQTAGTHASDAGVFAGAANAERLAAEVASAIAEAQANIATTQATTASEQAAIASSSVALAASIAGGFINLNVGFDAWPAGSVTPSYWTLWSGLQASDLQRGVDSDGSYYARTVNNNQNSGLLQSVNCENGWYVMEAEVNLNNPGFSYVGSGLTLQGWYVLNFAFEPDTSGEVSAIKLGVRRFTKLFRNTVGLLTNFHAMHNWESFTQTPQPKELNWRKVSIRPASEAEILTGTVLPDLQTTSAQHTSDIAAVASVNGAQASQIDTLTTSFNGLSATVAVEASSIDGLQLRYGVLLDSNGYITGFVQNNNGNSGSFTVLADNFNVAIPGMGAYPVFAVDDQGVYMRGTVRIDGDLLVSGSVGAPQLAGSSVARTVYQATSAAIQIPYTSSSGGGGGGGGGGGIGNPTPNLQ